MIWKHAFDRAYRCAQDSGHRYRVYGHRTLNGRYRYYVRESENQRKWVS